MEEKISKDHIEEPGLTASHTSDLSEEELEPKVTAKTWFVVFVCSKTKLSVYSGPRSRSKDWEKASPTSLYRVKLYTYTILIL
jgi:hypothetical protein